MTEIETLIQTCRELIEDWNKTNGNPKWIINKGLVDRAEKEFRLTPRVQDGLTVCENCGGWLKGGECENCNSPIAARQ